MRPRFRREGSPARGLLGDVSRSEAERALGILQIVNWRALCVYIPTSRLTLPAEDFRPTSWSRLRYLRAADNELKVNSSLLNKGLKKKKEDCLAKRRRSLLESSSWFHHSKRERSERLCFQMSGEKEKEVKAKTEETEEPFEQLGDSIKTPS